MKKASPKGLTSTTFDPFGYTKASSAVVGLFFTIRRTIIEAEFPKRMESPPSPNYFTSQEALFPGRPPAWKPVRTVFFQKLDLLKGPNTSLGSSAVLTGRVSIWTEGRLLLEHFLEAITL